MNAKEKTLPAGDTEVKQTMIHIICDSLHRKPHDVHNDTRIIEDLGADSLDCLLILLEFETTFNINIPLSDQKNAQLFSTSFQKDWNKFNDAFHSVWKLIVKQNGRIPSITKINHSITEYEIRRQGWEVGRFDKLNGKFRVFNELDAQNIEFSLQQRIYINGYNAGYNLKDEAFTNDVHTEHCCVVHGCKYNEDESCPVVQGKKPQCRPCELCQL